MPTWVWIVGGLLVLAAVALFLLIKLANWLMPSVDPFHGDAAGRRVLQRLKMHDDYREGQSFLAGIEDFDLRAWYCAAFNEALKGWGDRGYLDLWVGAEGSTSSIPHLFRGINRVHWAWEARGSGTGDTVTEDMANLFVERLVEAQRDLLRALELEPNDPTPLAYLIAAAKGVSLPLAEVATLYGKAHQINPQDVGSARAMLSALSEKWVGTHEQMFAFARERVEEAPVPHLMHGLIADAHIERWLYHFFDEDVEGAARYFKQPEVHAELVTAFEACLGGGRLPSSDVRFVQSWNDFAFCFWRTGDSERARRCFSVLQRHHVTELPWGYLDNNAINTFEEIRRSFGAKVG